MEKEKKTFIITELVILFAMIMILFAMLVPSNINNRTEQPLSADEVLIKSLNDSAKFDETTYGKPNNVEEAKARMEKNGYLLESIVPHNYNNVIAWDSKTNTYLMFNVQTKRFLNNSNFEGISLSKDVWLFTKTYDATWGFSAYLKSGFDDSQINISAGLHVGDNEIETINYNRASAEVGQSVFIYTNSENTVININAPKDVIYHYGEAKIVNAIAISTSSYHEFGTTKHITLKQGRVVVENNSNVETLSVAGNNAIIAKAESATLPLISRTDDVSVFYVQTTAQNVDSSVITQTKVEITVDEQTGNKTVQTKTTDALGRETETPEVVETDVAPKVKNTVDVDEEGVVVYIIKTAQDLKDFANSELEFGKLAENVTVTTYTTINSKKSLDLNGKSISYAGSVTNTTVLYVNGGDLTITNSKYETEQSNITVTNKGRGIWVLGSGKFTNNNVNISAPTYAIFANTSSVVKINGGDIFGGSAGIYLTNSSEAIINSGNIRATTYGVLALEGAKFTLNDGTVSGQYAVLVQSQIHAEVIIHGGEISGTDYALVSNYEDALINIDGGKVICDGYQGTASTYAIFFKNGVLNIENALVQNKNTNGAPYAIYTNGTTEENVINIKNNAKVICDNGFGVVIYVQGTLNMTGGEVLSNWQCFSNNGSGTVNSVVNMSGGRMISESLGIYNPGVGTLNISGNAYIEGGNTGIEMRAGELNMTGGKIVSKNTEPIEIKANGSGSTINGVALSISQHTTKKNIVINISGGELEGYSALYEANPQHNSNEDLAKVVITITGGKFTATGEESEAIHINDYAVEFNLSQQTAEVETGAVLDGELYVAQAPETDPSND